MDFFQERKLLVAWRRTNEISGENLTNVFARTYTRRRIAPIPVQSFQSFRNFREKLGADRNGRGKKKRKRKKSIPPLVSRRLEIISSWTGDPGNRSYFLDKSCFEADNGRKKGKEIEGIARCSRLELPRFFSSSSPSWLRENRLSRINQSRPWFLCCVWSVVGHETCFVKCKEEREEERRRSLCKGKKEEEEGKERWRGRGKS